VYQAFENKFMEIYPQMYPRGLVVTGLP